ncbi:unnamed protein product, partial [Oppiella nova]
LSGCAHTLYHLHHRHRQCCCVFTSFSSFTAIANMPPKQDKGKGKDSKAPPKKKEGGGGGKAKKKKWSKGKVRDKLNNLVLF